MKQTLINIILLAIAVIILIIMLDGNKIENKYEVKVTLDKKPIVKEYHFTQPTIYKEKVIEYNTHEVITKEDSSRIIADYLKERMYLDSIINDTCKIRYKAIVSRNSLNDLEVDYSYKPMRIETMKTKNGIILGLVAGWAGEPTMGLSGGFQTNKYSYSLVYDAVNQRWYLVLSRRLYFGR